MTGYNFPPADNGQGQVKPGMGAILARARGSNNATTGLPTYVRMSGILGDGPSWLGSAYAPFDVAGNYLMKRVSGQVRDRIDPRKMFYEAQKLRIRAARLIEAVERLAGSRPGPKLQVQFRGIEGLESTIHRAGRRLALALSAAGVLVGTAVTAASARVAGWIPVALGTVGGLLLAGLALDLLRRRR